jgi:predicted transcriptional regulator
MIAVARGERSAPADAAKPSFNSAEAIVRLLTSENRHLLATIRDHAPRSIAELAHMTGRAQPNLTRTIAKLKAAGLVTTKTIGRRKVLRAAAIKKIVVEIDPFSDQDRLRVG